MAYDAFVLAACIKDINEHALYAKINKIHQPDKNTLVLRYYGKNGAGRILLSASATESRLHLSALNPENPAKAPLFLMVARKWLEGAVLTEVRQTPWERVAELIFATRNEVGDAVKMRLVAEIMGKHSNIILVDEDGMILDGIRRYDSSLSRWREVLPQRPYTPPPPLDKALPPFADEEALAEALLQGELLAQPLEKALSRRLAGLSPWLARETLAQAGLSQSLNVEDLGLHELRVLLQALNALTQRPQNGDFAPTLLLTAGRPADFAAFNPVSWPEQERRAYSTMSEVLDAYYQDRNQKLILEQQRRHLTKPLQQHITRLQRKISHQREDLSASEQGERYKLAADLLSAHLFSLREENASSGRGLTEISLPSFDDPAREVRIDLDAALTPQQNIQRYYRKYNKCRKARDPIEQHLSAAEQELEYALNIAVSLATATLPQELAEIEQELKSAALLPAPPPAKGKKPGKEKVAAALPPRRYLSADGFTILVGRNNKQNDRLSLKTAAPDDIWLHTQKIPGSHVIIACEGKDVPDTTLTEAAAYAAWFSQAQDSPKVAVDYTRAAQVKKPAGAKPGMVIYFQQQTVYVQPKQPAEQQEDEL